MPEDFPVGRAATQVFFKQEDQMTPTIGRRLPPDLDNPNTCRWCLQRFDPAAQQPRTTWERGQLRTRLKMADNGSELIICDNCWPAAYGYSALMVGQPVAGSDPEVIPNPLLRAI